MKKTLLLLSLLATAAAVATAQNYDKSKIPPFKLEDPLTFVNGKKVRTAKDWETRRREILDIFQKEMYGKMPEDPGTIVTETLEEGPTLADFGYRKQIRMWFREDKSGPKIDWLVVTPARIEGPVPTVILLNYNGNHTVLVDDEVFVYPGYTLWNTRMHTRGELSNPDSRTIIPVDDILARGYALVTACYEDISPDPDPTSPEVEHLAYTRVFELWGERDERRTDNTTSLVAWAWGLRRGMDLIERLPELDAGNVLLTGYSRLGKAAFIASAFDRRFKVTVPNQTGGGGIPLAKHYYGENIHTEMNSFPHWYCKAYGKYADNEGALTFDQHLFASCIAPRAFLVEGFDNPWYDTESEFMCLQAASPVWEFLGAEGLPKVAWPDDYDTKAIGPTLGYVRRDLEHGISAIDWLWMLDFAEKQFGK
ncbi:MAG: hypothetical protein MJY45_06065 [Bacteroidales bacterium]|nr:hypothetical protein [Bacteroidales bacterium]